MEVLAPARLFLLAIPAGVKLLVLCLSTQISEDNKLRRNVEKKRLQISELSEFDQPFLV